MAGARELKKKKKELPLGVVIGGTFAGVLLGGYLGLCAWVNFGGIMPNVTVGGLDVGGLSQEQAQVRLEQAMKSHAAKGSVTLRYGDWSGTVTGDQMQIFGENAALEARKAGRGNFLTQGVEYIQHLAGNREDVELNMGFDCVAQQALEALLDEAEREASRAVSGASYEVKGDRLVMTKGSTGLSVDREAVRDAVYQAFEENVLLEAFRGRVSNQVVELTMTQSAPDTPDFERIRQEMCVEPQNASLDPRTFEIIPHTPGVQFETVDLINAYNQANEGETFSIPVRLIQPEETAEVLQSKLFADLLGEGTSTVSGSANRKFNVKLSAQACNNVILMPGDVFSYNNTTGSRSADKGYLPAPVYSGGKSVDETGGGICQTSSTIYYAVLHTTLEVVERSAHMYATGYVPDGMDATVYYGALDFRFRNNTNYPVKIVTESYDKGGVRYLTVKLYGTNEDGRYAVPERTRFDWQEPTVQYLSDESIPRGTTKMDEKQNPYTGRKAQTYRHIYEADGTLVETQDMGVSKYKMRPKTVYYNPLDGDPATWVNGTPPKPGANPDKPVLPVIPDTQPGEGTSVTPPQTENQNEIPVTPPQTENQNEIPVTPSQTENQNEIPVTPPQTEDQNEIPVTPSDPSGDSNADLKPGELPPGY